jgi:aspartate aminotransferase
MQLSRRLARITPSATTAMNERAIAMRRDGREVLNFAVGEPDFPTPEHIRRAGIDAIEAGLTRYTPAAGSLEIKEAICAKFAKDNHLKYTPSQIAVTSGGKHALYNILFVLCNDGDEVLVPAPYWVSYTEMVRVTGAEAVIMPTGIASDFKITPGQLRDAITPKTKAILFNSPSNPTGMVYSREEIEALASVLAEAGIYVISDELYEKILFDGHTHTSIASVSTALKEKTVIVNGLSKAYCMTGWRLGYAAGPQDVMDGFIKFQGQTVMHPSAISQYAGVAALTGSDDFIAPMVAAFDERRNYIVDRFTKMNGIDCIMPGGAFYVFPDMSAHFGRTTPDGMTIQGSLDLAAYLLESVGVVTVPGIAFGAEGCIRLSYATSMDIIEKGVDAIDQALNTLGDEIS